VRLVYANFLIYAHVANFGQHHAARAWLNAITPIGLPWPSLLAFVRLVSNPRVFEHPESIENAWEQVERDLKIGPIRV